MADTTKEKEKDSTPKVTVSKGLDQNAPHQPDPNDPEPGATELAERKRRENERAGGKS